MFLDKNGERFRVLKPEPEGAWLISYDDPGPPRLVNQRELDACCRIPTPEPYAQMQSPERPHTDAEQVRMDMIQPMLDNEACISDQAVRQRLAAEAARDHGTNRRRVLRLYYQYLATGAVMKHRPPRHRPSEYEPFYKSAIQTFYYSAKRPSLRDAYDLMLHQYFLTPDGSLMEQRPTWPSFRHYFYDNLYHRRSERTIAREGLSNYQRNARPLTGSVMAWKDHIGAYQMDATLADLYLVSRLDRTRVVGRPYVYLAVDTATQLIAGLYVGYDAGEEAVMACLANAAADKVEYCRGYGIDINAADWPSRGLPSEVITDQGRDFLGSRMKELCRYFGVTCEALPPFRPDRKGLVEKMFDLLQNRYKPILRGRGVIEADAQERWAVDYRAQASLDLTQFTQVLIHCILYLNSRRVLENHQMSADMRKQGVAPTAAGLWQYYATTGKSALLELNSQEVYYMSLPRKTCKLTRKGISHNHFLYVNAGFLTSEAGQRQIGQKVSIACDEQSVGEIYLVLDGDYIPFQLAPQYAAYDGAARTESELYWKADRRHKQDYRKLEEEGRVELLQKLTKIRDEAKPEVDRRQNGADINAQRAQERRRSR